MAGFYASLRDALKDEQSAGNLYATLAKDAPTQEVKDILYEMARQEIMHRAHLECLLLGNDTKA